MARSHPWHAVMLIGALVLTGLPPTSHAAGDDLLFVRPDAQATGDGRSWANAYSDVQVALNAAVSGYTIWVAKGSYTPHPSDRSASFVLPVGVAIYGGFAGTETDLAQRDWQAHPTILSGDLLGNDASTGTNAENSRHVVRSTDATASTRLDGFIISGGNADSADGINDTGGGIYNVNSSPTLANLTISGNTANYGGGMLNLNSSPTLTNVTISGNTANYGGGMLNLNSSSPTLTNVTISGNTANYGGGMDNQDSSPTLTNVTLSGNTAQRWGGGIYNINSSPILTNVTLSGNTAQSWGGGIYNNNGSSPVLTNVTLNGNVAAVSGGGMYNNNGSSPVLTNVTLSGNTAQREGGGMHNDNGSSPTLANVTLSSNTANFGGGMYNFNSSSPMLRGVTISGNTAQSEGGGMYNDYGSNPTLINVTLSGNTAQSEGGGMYNDNSSPTLINVTLSGNTAQSEGGGMFNYGRASLPNVRNSIVWGNAPNALAGNAANVQDSLIAGGYAGTGNLALDPQFVTPVDPASAPTTAGNLRLRPASPAIDAGLDSALPGSVVTDRDGTPRLVDVPNVGAAGRTVDLGTYESPVLRVAGSTLLDANPTTAAQVRFALTFSAPVTDVNLADLRLTTLGVRDAAVVALIGSGSVYTVTVSTGSGVGTVRLDIAESTTIADALGYPLGGLPYTGGETYLRQQRTVDAVTLIVGPNPATVGQVVTLTARISATNGTPSGNVEFRDGATVLGSASLDATGEATLTTSSLAVGAHALVAVYSGDATFAGGTSSAISLVVQPGPSTAPAQTVYLPLVRR